MEDKLQVITDLENEMNADAGFDPEVKTKALSCGYITESRRYFLYETPLLIFLA